MNEPLMEGMATILSELEARFSADEIGAVQINMVLRDGTVRTMQAWDNGFALLMVAAVSIGQDEAKVAIKKAPPTVWRGEPA